MDYPTDPTQRAAHALRRVLGGDAPNGIAPESCGAWQDTVAGVYAGYATGGTPKARQVYETLVKAHPPLARLVSEDAKPADTWGGILPFHAAELPAFPLDVLPDWLREFCEAITETMQTPTDLAGMLALSVLSAACGGLVEVKVDEGFTEPVVVYTVTGLPPGTGKSPVFRAMTAPIVKFERMLLEKSEDEIATAEIKREIIKQRITEAKSQAAKAKSETDRGRAMDEIEKLVAEQTDLIVPARPKLIIDDATPESVASILADQGGRIAVLSSEGDIFAIMAGRYSSGAPNIGVYKKGHAGDELRVDRKTRSEVISRPAITMGITTQPEVMRAFGKNETFQSEGLLARFFYALPKSNVGNRKPRTAQVPETTRDLYFYRMLNLLENVYSRNSRNSRDNESNSRNSSKNHLIDDSNNILYIEISDTGRNMYYDFKAWIEPQLGVYGAFHSLADWANKLPGAVLRVAGLLHMAESAAYNSYNSYNSYNAISDATMARAIRFAQYLIPHALAAYAEIGADPAVEGARLVLRWIERTSAKAFTKQQCYQGCKGTLKRADDLNPVLSLLCDHGYLREIEAPDRGGPGRKAASSYEVNPAVFGQNGLNGQDTPPAASYEPPPAQEYRERGYTPMEGY